MFHRRTIKLPRKLPSLLRLCRLPVLLRLLKLSLRMLLRLLKLASSQTEKSRIYMAIRSRINTL
jgi:hypothetical protein